jgi:hypothetical protein
MTLLSGSAVATGGGIAVDTLGNIYFSGTTNSSSPGPQAEVLLNSPTQPLRTFEAPTRRHKKRHSLLLLYDLGSIARGLAGFDGPRKIAITLIDRAANSPSHLTASKAGSAVFC